MSDYDENYGFRIAQLERQVALLMARLGVQDPGPTTTASMAVVELVRQGKKLEAIKQYRQDTGVGLAEAKLVVDQIA